MDSFQGSVWHRRTPYNNDEGEEEDGSAEGRGRLANFAWALHLVPSGFRRTAFVLGHLPHWESLLERWAWKWIVNTKKLKLGSRLCGYRLGVSISEILTPTFRLHAPLALTSTTDRRDDFEVAVLVPDNFQPQLLLTKIFSIRRFHQPQSSEDLKRISGYTTDITLLLIPSKSELHSWKNGMWLWIFKNGYTTNSKVYWRSSYP